MAIDLDAVRARLNKLQRSSAASHKWRPEDDSESTVRIVPFKHNPDYPFQELYFHYNLGNKTYLSPQSFDEPDPVVVFVDELKSTGEREDWEYARKIEPKLRTYVPIVVRGEEDKGVRFWGFGKTVYESLLEYMADPDYGDITDPLEGRDIKIIYKSAKTVGKNYPETTIMVRPNRSQLSDDSKVMKKMLDEQPTLEEVFEREWSTYDDLKIALEKWLAGDSSDSAKVPESKTTQATTQTDDELPWDKKDSTDVKLDEEIEDKLVGLFDED